MHLAGLPWSGIIIGVDRVEGCGIRLTSFIATTLAEHDSAVKITELKTQISFSRFSFGNTNGNK